MTIILRHILRNIRKNWFSGILIVVSVALSAAVVYLNFNIASDMVDISRRLFTGMFGSYDMTVTAPVSDDNPDGTLEIADSDFEGGILRVSYGGGALVRDDSVTETTVLFISSDWQKAADDGLITLSSGEFPTDGGIMITEKKSARHGISLGDKIKAADGNEIKEYTVTALCSSIGMFADERPDCIEVLRVMNGEKVTAAFLDTPGSADDAAEKLAETHPEWKVELLSGGMDIEKNIGHIRVILYMVLALAMVMGFYIISSVTTLMLDGRMPVIGTFRSVGASRGKMNALLVAENAVYGVFGGFLGVAVGGLLRVLLATLYYNTSDTRHEVNLLYAAAAVLFAIILQVGITVRAVIKAGSLSIRENMFRSSAVAAEVSVVRTILGAVLFTAGAVLHLTNGRYVTAINLAALGLVIVGAAMLVPFLLKLISGSLSKLCLRARRGTLWLAFRNLSASRINISSVILTTMVIALSFVILLCTTSVASYFASYENNYPYDIFVKGVMKPEGEYSFVDELEGVGGTVTEYWDYRFSRMNGVNQKLCFIRAKGYSNGVTFEDGADDSALESGHCIIDRLFAVRNGIKAGDTVHFCEQLRYDNPVKVITNTDTAEVDTKKNGEDVRPELSDSETAGFYVTVDGFCDSGVFNSKRTSVVLCAKDYYANVENCPALIGVTLAEGADEDTVMADLVTEIFVRTGENASAYSKTAYLSREVENTYDALAIFSVVPVLASALAVLGLANNQIISYNRKKREYAVLYSVATSRAGLCALVFAELALVFISGMIFGVALGVVLMRIVRDVIFGLIAYVEITFDFGRIAFIFLGVFGLLCVSGLLPGRMVAKINVVEEIQYD